MTSFSPDTYVQIFMASLPMYISNGLLSLELMIPFPQNQMHSSTNLKNCSRCSKQILMLHLIPPFLSLPKFNLSLNPEPTYLSTYPLFHATIASKLDFCSGLLIYTPSSNNTFFKQQLERSFKYVNQSMPVSYPSMIPTFS